MNILSERHAEDFLEKEGFRVVERAFSRSRFGLRKALFKVGFPFVLKASGKKLLPNGDVSLKHDVKNYTCALEEFKQLKKINGAEGVLVQRKIPGKEFFVSLKKASKTRCTISFGFFILKESGEKEVVLKVFTDIKKNIKKIVEEGGKFGKLSSREKKSLERFILDMINFINKNENISEIVVGSLIVDGKNATIVNAKVEFR
ncbi:MAG: hypothetical protein Q8Q04_01815 [archaeon]|nr:hypothetical protein [archaeon]